MQGRLIDAGSSTGAMRPLLLGNLFSAG